MSSKSKLIIGIVLLAVGAGLIPTGILTNNYLRDAVYEGVPEALQGIKDEATSEIQDMVPTLGTPSVLAGLKEEIVGLAGEAIFYTQWANGTYSADGFLYVVTADDDFRGPPYFELGLPDPSNMSVEMVEKLWDTYNSLAFANGHGFDVWLGAVDNATLRGQITEEFNITATEFTMISDWLNSFINKLTVPIIELMTGFNLYEYSFRLFYEQWANGTIGGSEVIPDGFLSMRDPPIYGPPYFELGLKYPCGLKFPQVEELWNKWNDKSLITVSGIKMWYAAKQGNEQWKALADEFDLNYIQMIAIKKWLPPFRDVIVNKLAKDDLNLPMEPYDLGNVLFLTLVPIGSVLVILGIIVIILSRRS